MRGLVLAVALMVAMCGAGAAADIRVPTSVIDTGTAQANTIDPYELLGMTREELAERFPSLPATELDKLVFKIADINSMRTLPR